MLVGYRRLMLNGNLNRYELRSVICNIKKILSPNKSLKSDINWEVQMLEKYENSMHVHRGKQSAVKTSGILMVPDCGTYAKSRGKIESKHDPDNRIFFTWERFLEASRETGPSLWRGKGCEVEILRCKHT